VLFRSKTHIAIVSDRKATGGAPLIIHNRGFGVQEENRLFAEKMPLIQALSNPLLGDAEALPIMEQLEKDGIMSKESLLAIRKIGHLGGKVAGAAEGILNLNAEYAKELQFTLASGLLPEEDFFKGWDAALQAYWQGLPPEIQEAVNNVFPQAAFLGRNGQAARNWIAPARGEVSIEDAGKMDAEAFKRSLLASDTLAPSVISAFTNQDIQAMEVLRPWMEGFIPGFSGGGTPSIVLQLFRGKDFGDFSTGEQSQLTNLGLQTGGDAMKLAAIWVQAKTGRNPFQQFVIESTGEVVTLNEDASLKAWAYYMEPRRDNKGKVIPFTLEVNGRHMTIAPLLRRIATSVNLGNVAKLEQINGKWHYRFFQGQKPDNSDTNASMAAAIAQAEKEKQGGG